MIRFPMNMGGQQFPSNLPIDNLQTQDPLNVNPNMMMGQLSQLPQLPEQPMFSSLNTPSTSYIPDRRRPVLPNYELFDDFMLTDLIGLTSGGLNFIDSFIPFHLDDDGRGMLERVFSDFELVSLADSKYTRVADKLFHAMTRANLGILGDILVINRIMREGMNFFDKGAD